MTNIANKTVIQGYKQIHDCIHGYISISDIMVMVIDTKPFQRLRELKQLGSCYWVYPPAVHTRFEHSIGTYHYADRILNCIIKNTNPVDVDQYLASIPELKQYYDKKYGGKIHVLDDYVCELLKICAGCHDLGHGPYSHVFDDFFLPYIKKELEPCDHHEYRSGMLLEMIIKGHKKLSKIISDDEIQFMKNVINPSKEHVGFLYEIVSNYRNGLDVDKYEYIRRDSYVTGLNTNFNCDRLIDHVRIIDNSICYQEQAIGDIIELYNTRYKLHKTVYGHKSVIAAQYMLIEIFKYLDKIIGLSESVKDMNKFCMMTDEYILSCHRTLLGPHCNLPKNMLHSLTRAVNIINKLECHQLYSHVDTYVSDHKIDINRKQFQIGTNSDILIYRNIIGYVSGNKQNPLDNIYVFRTKDLNNTNEKIKSRKINIGEYSLLTTKNYQEHLTMLFYKQKNKKTIAALREEFREFIKTGVITEKEKGGKIPQIFKKIEHVNLNDTTLTLPDKRKRKNMSIFDDLDEQFNQLTPTSESIIDDATQIIKQLEYTASEEQLDQEQSKLIIHNDHNDRNDRNDRNEYDVQDIINNFNDSETDDK